MKVIIKILLLSLTAYASCDTSSFEPWSDWDFASTDLAPCIGLCDTGTQTRSRTQECCYPTCEGATTESESADCSLDRACVAEADVKAYMGYRCGTDESEWLGNVGSSGECQALAPTATYVGFWLECTTDATTEIGCYGCTASTNLASSACGSNTYLEPDYTWNYILLGGGLGIAVFVLLSAFLTHTTKCCENSEKVEQDEVISKHNLEDELQVDIDEQVCGACCPVWFNLTVSTTSMCFVGFALGAVVNIALEDSPAKQRSDWLEVLYYPAELWIAMLKLIVTPLIALMMVTLPDRVNVVGSNLGFYLVGFYVCTSFVAAIEGLIWVNIIKPGNVELYLAPTGTGGSDELTELDSLLGIGRKAIAPYIFAELASGNVLAIIVFFLTLGCVMQSEKIPAHWRDTFLLSSKAALKSIMMTVPMVIKITPWAMICVVTVKIASIDNLELVLKSEAMYVLTVLVAHSIHAFVIYPLILSYVKVNGWAYFMDIRQAPFTAFATSSSAATLPVTLETLKEKSVSFEIADFVAPLGCAINMDGTSCGFPIITMFTAQLIGYEVKAGTQIVLALLAMTCSVGTAPIPNAGVVYLTMLFTAMGGTLAESDNIALGLGMFLTVDWFVDRIETAQNVWSDCCASKFFDQLGYGEELRKLGDEKGTALATKDFNDKREPENLEE